jgi:predicted RNase H-like HicB family nuclease
MDGKIEQFICINFCVKLGKSTTKTLEMLREASGEHSLSWKAIFEWHSCFVLSTMDGKIEQRVYIKFCVKLGKSATETLEMLREAFGEHSLNQAAVFEWH